MDRSTQDAILRRHLRGLSTGRLDRLESIMDGWFKQEADAALHRIGLLSLRNTTLQMRLERVHMNWRNSQEQLRIERAAIAELQDENARLNIILHEVFANDAALRHQYADRVIYRDLWYEPGFDSEETEVESLTDWENDGV